MMAVSSLRDVLKLLPMLLAAVWLAVMPAFELRNPSTLTPQTPITADDAAAITVADRIDMLNNDIVIAGLFMAVLPTSYEDAALVLAGSLGALEKWAAKYPKLARHFEKILDKLNAPKGGVNRGNAENIAGGHAWTKHQDEFKDLGITNEQQFADHIENVIDSPTQSGSLSNGRSYAYDANTNTIVILNPNAVDGGTAFIIDPVKFPNPQDYIDTLK